MRTAVVALLPPLALMAGGVAAMYTPKCGLAAAITVAYLVMTPLAYYARPYVARNLRRVAVAASSMAALWALQYALAPLLSHYDVTNLVVSMLSTCDKWKIYLTLSAIVLAPAAEEALFRGVLFQELEKRAGLAVAYVGSALAFAAAHGFPALIPLYFAYGLVLTHAFRGGGFLFATLLHGVNNLLALYPILQ